MDLVPEWMVVASVCVVVALGLLIVLGVVLYVLAYIADRLYQWCGFGREIVFFIMWRRRRPGFRIQLWDGGKWVTTERWESERKPVRGRADG